MAYWFLKCKECGETAHVRKQEEVCPSCKSNKISCKMNKGIYKRLDRAAENYAKREAIRVTTKK